MKICIVGHFDNRDEGVRNVAKTFYSELKKKYEVKKANISSIQDLITLIRFNADIIHLVLTPTLTGILISKIISVTNPRSKVIISAIHPSLPKWKILKLFKVDLVLVQTKESENLFKNMKFPTKVLYNSVDIEKFRPVDEFEKQRLREKYRIPQDKFVILHLGSLIRKVRNLEILNEIQNDKYQVLIIGRVNENIDYGLLEELKESGCLVWINHFQNIEDIYNLSDCYILPTWDKHACVETPLSVLEAMACDIPVITTHFGTLPDLFVEGDGFFFFEESDDIYKILNNIKDFRVDNRRKIFPFSTKNILRELESIYHELLKNNPK